MRAHASISFSIDEDGPVRLQMFDATGHLVDTLLDRELPAGGHRLSWDGRAKNKRLPAGIYLYRLVTPFGTQTKKLLLTAP